MFESDNDTYIYWKVMMFCNTLFRNEKESITHYTKLEIMMLH